MKQPELDLLIDLARRRVLTDEERARLDQLLAANPAGWPNHADELALTRLLDRLPDAPLASNFSSRVMQAIELAEADVIRASQRRSWLSLRGWMGRLAWSTAAVALSLTSWAQYRTWQRTEYARSITAISEVAAVPSVEMLRDFEVIHTFARVPTAVEAEADISLLAALQ